MTSHESPLSDIGRWKRCDAGQCLNVVRKGTTYCCAPCRLAWEATPRYEPHEHSVHCADVQPFRADIARRLTERGL